MPTPEPDLHRRLRLRFQAEGRPGLFAVLQAAVGSVLAGGFRLDSLQAVGRQSFVFAGTALATGAPVVVKQAAFDYGNAVAHTAAGVTTARHALRVEYDALRACTTGHFPVPVALLTAAPVVPAAADIPSLAAEELFLVEEHIRGISLTRAALEAWPALPAPAREDAARRVAAGFVAFWEALWAAGWYYGDVSAGNLMLEEGGRLRVVDGGSAVPAAAEACPSGYTPAFTTPRLFEALSQGRPVPGNLATVLPPLAKVLHFALTRKEPLNGALPDLDHSALHEYTPACRQALAALLHLDAHPEELSAARAALLGWANPPARQASLDGGDPA